MIKTDSAMNLNNSHTVDWSKLPVPEDDGKASHLEGMALPAISLPATQAVEEIGHSHSSAPEITLSELKGTTVVFAYPMTARPDTPLPDNWDIIPGARGCTPQACAFRDLAQDLKQRGADHVFGLSTQKTAYQKEAAERLHLPFPLLSDYKGELRNALRLPFIIVDNMTLLKRLSLVIHNGVIEKIWYPVFPPDKNAEKILQWLEKKHDQ